MASIIVKVFTICYFAITTRIQVGCTGILCPVKSSNFPNSKFQERIGTVHHQSQLILQTQQLQILKRKYFKIMFQGGPNFKSTQCTPVLTRMFNLIKTIFDQSNRDTALIEGQIAVQSNEFTFSSYLAS